MEKEQQDRERLEKDRARERIVKEAREEIEKSREQNLDISKKSGGGEPISGRE